MPSVSRRALGTAYLVMLMDTLNFGIVFPLVPSIAKDFGANATMVGSMATVYSLCQFLMAPILGRLSDRFGRRPVLLVSVLGTTLSSFGTGFAWTFNLVLAARCVNGASGGTVGVVQAFVADVTNSEERKIYVSYISAVNAIGLVVGPALGGAFSRLGFAAACYLSAALSAVNLLAALAFLPESRWQQEVSTPLSAGGAAGASREMLPVADGKIPCKAGLLFAASFLNILGLAAMESVMSYYLMDKFFNGNAKETGEFYGLCFTFVGVAMFIVSFFCYKPLVQRFGQRPMVAVGALLRATAFSLQPLAPTRLLFALCIMVVVSGGQLVVPTSTAMLTTMCPKSIYGRALSYQQSCATLARVLGPVVFGRVYDRVDHDFSFHVCAVASAMAGCLIVLVPARRRPAQGAVEADGPERNVLSQEGPVPEGGACLDSTERGSPEAAGQEPGARADEPLACDDNPKVP